MNKKLIIALTAVAVIFAIAVVLIFYGRKPNEEKGESIVSAEIMQESSDTESVELAPETGSETKDEKSRADFPKIPMK